MYSLFCFSSSFIPQFNHLFLPSLISIFFLFISLLNLLFSVSFWYDHWWCFLWSSVSYCLLTEKKSESWVCPTFPFTNQGTLQLWPGFCTRAIHQAFMTPRIIRYSLSLSLSLFLIVSASVWTLVLLTVPDPLRKRIKTSAINIK